MDRLRTRTRLTRLVLAWFVLFVGAAVFSPLVRPATVDFICSGHQIRLAEESPDTTALASHTSHLLDCPACMPDLIGPPEIKTGIATPTTFRARLAYAKPIWIAAPALASLPARGPPARA